MALTVQNVVDAVRPMINDEIPSYRWVDGKILQYAIDGQREMYTRKPLCIYTEGTIRTTLPADPTTLSGTLAIHDRFKVSLAHYIAYRCHLEDSEDGNDGSKTKEHWGAFIQGLS